MGSATGGPSGEKRVSRYSLYIIINKFQVPTSSGSPVLKQTKLFLISNSHSNVPQEAQQNLSITHIPERLFCLSIISLILIEENLISKYL